MTKRLTMMLLGVALILGMAGSANAISYVYSINAGNWLSGTIDIDTSSSSNFNANSVTSYDLNTTAWSHPNVGPISAYNWTPSTSSIGANFSFLTTINSSLRSLSFAGWNPLLNNNSVGPYTFTANEGYQYSQTINTRFGSFSITRTGTRGSTSGSGVSTPEPASLLLFGSGLAALGYWRYRKSLNA